MPHAANLRLQLHHARHPIEPPRLDRGRARHGRRVFLRRQRIRGADAGLRAMGRNLSRTRARARHFGADLRPRDERGHARHQRVRAAARAAGIHRADVAVHQSPLLGMARQYRQGARARICRPAGARGKGLRRRPLHAARAVGHGVVVRRRGDQHEIHAAGDPGAGGAGLGRAAPARLLGSRAAQRADHRRSRLGAALRHDRLLGRRHGPHPMDAGSVAAHGRRLRPRRPRHAVRQARRFACRHRALSARARQISPRRSLGLRGAIAGRLQDALGRQPHLALLRQMARARRAARRRRGFRAARTIR